jgi:hypothetical protein
MPIGWASQINGSFGSNDTIQFDLTGSAQQTITLVEGELLVSQSMSITGPGANQLAISGNNASRVIEIAAGTIDTISGLTIENGATERESILPGSGILNDGTLIVSGCNVSNNHGYLYGYYPSYGGGIENGGTLMMGWPNQMPWLTWKH